MNEVSGIQLVAQGGTGSVYWDIDTDKLDALEAEATALASTADRFGTYPVGVQF